MHDGTGTGTFHTVTPAERNDAIEIDSRHYAWRSIGSGPVLVLLNGYSASAQDWDPNLLDGLANSFTVICPDNRGMGESELGHPSGPPMTSDSMADDVERLLDHLDVERAPVAGWSMGGMIAQQLALRAPTRVEKLILLATDAGGPRSVLAQPEAWAALTNHTGTPREQATRLIPLLFPPAFVPAVEELSGDLVAVARAALSIDTMLAQQQAILEWHAEDPAAPDPDTAPPVLVLVGTEDIVVPPENAEVLATVWPRCEIERFEGGGHAFFALEPQRVAASITTFVATATAV